MRRWLTSAGLLFAMTLAPAFVIAQEKSATQTDAAVPKADTPTDGTEKKDLPLDISQQAVLGRFDRFEQEMLKMAEQMRRQDPERSDLLFRAHSRSQQEQIIGQMRVIFEQLARQDVSFGDAIQRQEALVASMKALLEVLQSENRIGDIEAERQRIQAIIKDVNRLLGDEKDARALTERGSDAERAAKKQEDIEKKATDLIESIKKDDDAKQAEEQSRSDQSQSGQQKDGEQKSGESKDGEPKDGEPKDGGKAEPKDGENEKSPQDEAEKSKIQRKDKDGEKSEQSPSDDPQQGEKKDGEQNSQSQPGQQNGEQQSDQQQTPGRQDLEQARDEMQRAIDELKKKNEKDASKHQDEAIRRLLEAKDKLEEILRQLREEEKALMLTSLESRFKKMLSEQLLVYQDTVQLAAKGKDEPNLEPRARQLARREDEIVQEVNKAMILLQEEGSSVAFPEAVEAIRDDMRSITRLLDQSDVGELTQTVEQGVIEALEEMLDALKQEMQKQNEDQQQQGQPMQPSAPGDEPLVDGLSELKMLRSLQLRINKRTQQLGKLAEGPEALNPELVDQLKTLSRRQAKIQRATFDLSTGRNQ
ncbi:hypothetical protein GC176_16970 [bacterium]|nr:hypothetical protein [bacterium]